MPEVRRSTREIRSSLAESRHHLEEDLGELEERIEDSLSPRHLFGRHPLLMSLAGALVGVLVVRKPSLVAKSVGRLAQIGAPFLLRAILKREASSSNPVTSGSETGSRNEKD